MRVQQAVRPLGTSDPCVRREIRNRLQLFRLQGKCSLRPAVTRGKVIPEPSDQQIAQSTRTVRSGLTDWALRRRVKRSATAAPDRGTVRMHNSC